MATDSARRHVVVLAPMPLELHAIVAAFGLSSTAPDEGAPWRGRVGHSTVTAIHVGMGPPSTRAATARLLDAASTDHVPVDHVMIAGICGGLDPDLPVGTLINPETVVEFSSGAAYRHAPPGDAAQAGKLVTTEGATLDHTLSRRLFDEGFVGVDMETSAVAEVCEARASPWSVYRCIGDRHFDGLLDERLVAATNPDGSGNMAEIRRLLAADPELARKLERLRRDTSLAARLAAEAAVRGCLALDGWRGGERDAPAPRHCAMTTPTLHPELAPLTDLVPTFELRRDGLAAMRAQSNEQFAAMVPPLSDAVERVDHLVSVDPHVVVRVHRPKAISAPAACLFSIHGGGYVLGSFAMDDPRLDRFCADFGCVGVSVEYRLAPETPYPGPLEDCYRALVWTFEHRDELGVDPTRIGIGGVSAGGGLAAGLALLARDRGEVGIAFQLLECPMIDDRQVTPSSQYDDLLIWSRAANTFGWQCYLGDLYGTADVPAYAAPARADELSGLPPSFVITGGADGFRDENILYALHLGHAGVPTDLSVIAGAPHGVHMFLGTTPQRRWAHGVAEWLQPRLASGD